MQAPVTKQSRKALPAQADDTTGDTAPDASAGSATDMAAETLDDAFDIAAVTAPPPPVPAVEPPPPPPPEFEPASLLGASSSKIEAVLGSADLLRREGTAEVWQYRLATCVVDYFVYPDANHRRNPECAAMQTGSRSTASYQRPVTPSPMISRQSCP
jgi:hypothetical protein